MKYLLIILVSVACVFAGAEDSFKKASGLYLQGRMALASLECQKGLIANPQDKNLLKLKERIEQNKESQAKEYSKRHPENSDKQNQKSGDNSDKPEKPDNKPDKSNPQKQQNMPGWDEKKALDPDEAARLLQNFNKDGKDKAPANTGSGKSNGKDW